YPRRTELGRLLDDPVEFPTLRDRDAKSERQLRLGARLDRVEHVELGRRAPDRCNLGKKGSTLTVEERHARADAETKSIAQMSKLRAPQLHASGTKLLPRRPKAVHAAPRNSSS